MNLNSLVIYRQDMREELLHDLVADLVGPRNGLRELMNADPRQEYLLGILTPADRPVVPAVDPDAEGEVPFAAETAGEDSNPDVDVSTFSGISPATSPKELPKSMGLSFVVRAVKGNPLISICATWSRYVKEKEGWRRVPFSYILRSVEVTSGRSEYSVQRKQNEGKTNSKDVSLWLITKQMPDGSYHVNTHFVNSCTPSESQTEDCVFQPEIRITCEENTEVRPLSDGCQVTEEEQVIYRNLPVYARGFLCAAVWKTIDPQRTYSVHQSKRLPFYWTNGEILSNEDRAFFSHPDIRTDQIPVYQISSPDLKWPEGFPEPVLNPETLSELWSGKELTKALSPVADAYETWVHQTEAKLSSDNQTIRLLVDRNLREVKQVVLRIREGIKTLEHNDDVRLAFCFANKAIALQAKWSDRFITWYPFQIAFILMSIESIANPDSKYRDICDLLWVSTGGGKTEAYLMLAAFTMAYRRRRALTKGEGDRTGRGVAVISRYTLRLLTIQQFRRTLALITAMEVLRVENSSGRIGWRPAKLKTTEELIWGLGRFSVGLWVGASVTPNKLHSGYSSATRQNIPGAFDILRGADGEGEPAQILKCPVCKSILAVPSSGLPKGRHQFHWVVNSQSTITDLQKVLAAAGGQFDGIVVGNQKISQIRQNYFTISIELITQRELKQKDIVSIYSQLHAALMRNAVSIRLVAVHSARPGYFITAFEKPRKGLQDKNIELYCPNPQCDLNSRLWCEGAPLDVSGGNSSTKIHGRQVASPDDTVFTEVFEPFQDLNSKNVSLRIPIPAFTVDEQLYHFIPSMLIATVDKFARLPYEPRCSALFGNVTHYDYRFGYYRPYHVPSTVNLNKNTGHCSGVKTSTAVEKFDPPDLIIQDELHLLDGPLGSMTGLYETAVDFLCSSRGPIPKYVASTATIKQADEQTLALFNRRLTIFPRSIDNVNDRFFVRFDEIHPLNDTRPGRLYVGICAPGRGPQTTIMRIWARLLQSTHTLRDDSKADAFWTLTGYFNAIRELAGAMALYKQDIPERLNLIGAADSRSTAFENYVELSSRTESTELPMVLDDLEKSYPNAKDALFTTSMFGTGIDIRRIGLMVVHGQPKTTASYIQATGRVGRQQGALVVVYYRGTRPRDLNHFEFFYGYHRTINRYVEPVTVTPFAPGALLRGGGPASIAILRNLESPNTPWDRDEFAVSMESHRQDKEVVLLGSIFEERAQRQPERRRPAKEYVQQQIQSDLDNWEQKAKQHADLEYNEYFEKKHPVVLGDANHKHAGKTVVFDNAPQSLRDIEETTTFYEG